MEHLKTHYKTVEVQLMCYVVHPLKLGQDSNLYSITFRNRHYHYQPPNKFFYSDMSKTFCFLLSYKSNHLLLIIQDLFNFFSVVQEGLEPPTFTI